MAVSFWHHVLFVVELSHCLIVITYTCSARCKADDLGVKYRTTFYFCPCKIELKWREDSLRFILERLRCLISYESGSDVHRVKVDQGDEEIDFILLYMDERHIIMKLFFIVATYLCTLL